MKNLRIGFCYNDIIDFPIESHHPFDISAEWTTRVDIDTIKNGLVSAGFDVIDIGNPQNLLNENLRKQVDLVFSIAEMTGYRYRESIAGVLCELFKKPYVLSKPDVLIIALDKHLTNLTLREIGINIPEWHLIQCLEDFEEIRLKDNPYILKPVAEGSSIGISNDSIVANKDAALNRASYLLKNYNQPVLMQDFIHGKEVTIAVIEDSGVVKALTPILVNNGGMSDVEFKKRASSLQPYCVLEDAQLVLQIQDTAIKIFNTLGCNDTARIDFRVDPNGNIYFIEINPLTDYTPRKDFCKSALASGYSYIELLRTIILNAWNRATKYQTDSERKQPHSLRS